MKLPVTNLSSCGPCRLCMGSQCVIDRPSRVKQSRWKMTATKPKPIIFQAHNIRAILAGTKTQTRRAVKPQPKEVRVQGCDWLCDDGRILRCPYGQPGDELWVKETWSYFGGDEYLYQQLRESVCYRADHNGTDSIPGGRWRSSMFMPRWASRITLRIESVRVERLQDITERDADAEGTTSHYPCEEPTAHREGVHRCTPTEDFRRSWDSINGKRPGCAWKDNPWVWVIEFRRI